MNSNNLPPVTEQRTFNLLNYKKLNIMFTGGDVDFVIDFKGSADIEDGGMVNLYVSSTTPQLLEFSKIPVPMKAKAQSKNWQIEIDTDESDEIKFSLDDQPLFIVQIDSDDLSVWFKSYDLAGTEMSALCIQKPGAVELEDEPEPKREIQHAEHFPGTLSDYMQRYGREMRFGNAVLGICIARSMTGSGSVFEKHLVKLAVVELMKNSETPPIIKEALKPAISRIMEITKVDDPSDTDYLSENFVEMLFVLEEKGGDADENAKAS
ncbi:MAG: hypothetical protein WBV94_31835 [Blastocatellia bacterium]